MKYVPPSVRETAFNCPHCHVLTTQTWFSLRAKQNDEKSRQPFILDPAARLALTFDTVEEAAERTRLGTQADLLAAGTPFISKAGQAEYWRLALFNVFVSVCFECEELSVWIHDRLVYPRAGEAPPASPDLPEELRRDYDEASSILDRSPRGAAALMRLVIQKLCIHLEQPGDNLNADIAALVRAGLDPQIQKALDFVRAIGNNAVHPGQIDLRDDRATAAVLFTLVNLIVERLISVPKHVDEAYGSLPGSVLQQIAKRDGAE